MESDELHSALFSAWDREIARSRTHWREDRDRGFAYNMQAPSIAYDPSSIPESPLGPFIHLRYSPPAEANHLAVTREEIEAGNDTGDLQHEFVNELIPHPERDDLIVIPNRWPRVSYHSLIVTRDLSPQILTDSLAAAELFWANKCFVVEFHRFDRILNHFHFHIYPGRISPIYRARNSFDPKKEFANFETGKLAGYPTPHIAIRSRDREWMTMAMARVSAHIDDLRTPYGQITMETADGSVVLLIFLRAPFRIEGVSFSLIGLVRTSNDFTLDQALDFTKNIHWSQVEMDILEAQLVARIGQLKPATL
jgi:hypothetical protein